MSKVIIVTDSTATIPKDTLDQYNIKVAPQILIWGDQTLLDGIDIQPGEFYDRLQTDNIRPTTSQVTPAIFNEIFEQLLEEDHHILAVLISTKLSGTIESANQALKFFPNAPIEIVDSQSVAMALGFQVLVAARAAHEGASLAECKELAEASISHTGVVFAVDTLEYLHRGGRIGGGTRFLGTALNIKPILEVRDGRVEAVERVRTRKKSITRLIELAEERIDGRQPVHLAVLHAQALQEAKVLLEDVRKKIETEETYFTEVSPVVGNNAGPGTIGLAYLAGM
jgi:DegV family protein with EDD domain